MKMRKGDEPLDHLPKHKFKRRGKKQNKTKQNKTKKNLLHETETGRPCTHILHNYSQQILHRRNCQLKTFMWWCHDLIKTMNS